MLALPTSQTTYQPCVLLPAILVPCWPLLHLCPHGDSSAHLRLFLKAWKSFPANRLISNFLTNQEMMENNGSHKILSQEMPPFFLVSILMLSLIFLYYCWKFSIALQPFPSPFPYGTKITY